MKPVIYLIVIGLLLAGCSNGRLSTIEKTTHSSTDDEWVLPDDSKNDSQHEPHSVMNGDIQAKPGVMTASITTGNRLLMSMVACTGVVTPSPRAKQMWLDKKGSLSVDGRANSITSPMLMAQAAIASEVCLDLINKERVLPAAERRIFQGIDFGQGPDSNSAAELGDITRRLARSCWGRNESAEERDMMVRDLQSNFSGNNTEETVKQLVYLCSAMLASASAIQM